MKTRLQRAKANPVSAADEARFEKFSSGLAELSTEELAARARPMTPDESARWQAARGGRPKKPAEQKAARVLLTIDPKLLETVTYAAGCVLQIYDPDVCVAH